jgi:DsbC/DsbD-like thiol-disulfide interchange protein
MSKIIALFLVSLVSLLNVQAQADGPVKWAFTTISGRDPGEVKLVLTAQLAPGWHIYSQTLEPGGPMPTKVSFGSSEDFVLVGKPIEEGKSESVYSPAFDANTVYYSNRVSFIQTVRLTKPVANISGKIQYMLCTKDRCMLPTDVQFTLTGEPGS